MPFDVAMSDFNCDAFSPRMKNTSAQVNVFSVTSCLIILEMVDQYRLKLLASRPFDSDRICEIGKH